MKKDTVETAALEISDTEFLRVSDVERFSDGSGYRCQISVQAGEFACLGRRFYFDELPSFVEQLRALHATLAGHAELRQRYEQEFVSFDSDSRGHIHVKGLLKDNPGCSLQFQLEADQTFIPPFIAGLERILGLLHA